MRSPCTATKSSPRSPQLEKARVQQQRPSTAKNNKINKIFKKFKKDSENDRIYQDEENTKSVNKSNFEN